MGKSHVYFKDSEPVTFIVHRRRGYAKKTVKGFRGTSWNSHHVLPCTSLKSSLDKFLDGKAPHFKQALGRYTKWNVNEEYNLIGLPHEAAYLAAYGDPKLSTLNFNKPQWMKAINFVAAIPPILPIHLPTSWGHTDYNVKVAKQLDKIWDKVDAKVKEHDKVEGNDLSSLVQAVSNVYCAKLTAKNGQTKERWEDENQREKFFSMPT
jgi:hypothetical protein